MRQFHGEFGRNGRRIAVPVDRISAFSFSGAVVF